MEYIKGIDGFRGVLVLVITLFHTFTVFFPEKLEKFPGGFLAVESFFVLSGYLITKTLIKTFSERARLSEAFITYIKRRFLRIFPSLFFVISVISLFVVLSNLFTGNHVKDESISGLSFFYNYYLIFRDMPYFQKFEDISFFLHLWSLSIEFQLYLIAGLIFLTVSLVDRKDSVIKFLIFLFLGFISVFFSYYYSNVLNINPDNIYFSSEARSFGFFFGGIVSLLEDKIKGKLGELSGYILGTVGSTSLMFSFFSVSVYTDWCYPLSFLLGDFFSIMVLLGFLNSNYIKESFGILDWFGKRSYPFYLWHYPIFVILNSLYGSDLFYVIFAYILVFLLSDLTHRLIEEPFRKLNFNIKPIPTLLSASILSSLITIFFYFETYNQVYLGKEFSKEDEMVKRKDSASSDTVLVRDVIIEEKKEERKIGLEEISSVKTKPIEGSILMIGDSVLLGASNYIKRTISDVEIDAKVGRQASEVFQIIDNYKDNIDRSSAVVIHLGNNGFIKQDILEGIVKRIGKDKKIYFLTVNAPVPWRDRVNSNIRSMTRYENVKVIEWDKLNNPELFVKDRVHLSGKGIVQYVKLIKSSLPGKVKFPSDRREGGVDAKTEEEKQAKKENMAENSPTHFEIYSVEIENSSDYIIKLVNKESGK
ncbi:MAG: acyltransferase [Hydrogenothermaceae bacterium]|nr:acyltransferase [Hydrogenothermaceae bacterium]